MPSLVENVSPFARTQGHVSKLYHVGTERCIHRFETQCIVFYKVDTSMMFVDD